MHLNLADLRLAAVACCLAAMLQPAPVLAAESSPWDGDSRSAVRLIAGSGKAATLRAGVEIRLGPGWKTYWRYPGDSGVPPVFDFKASQNVDKVVVLWPAPLRLADDGGISIGYKHSVILPLHVVARDPGKPVSLRLKLDYAICEKLCVPAEAKAELSLSGGKSSLEPALAKAEARVPKSRAVGEGDALSIRAVRRETAAKPRVLVDVATPSGVGVDLFAEGPTAEWALPLPTPVEGAPAGLQRFAFELDGAPPGAGYEGLTIKLTAVAGDEAIEVITRLD